MLDLCVSRKNKINLSDYEYEMDIRNRLLMSTFTPQDIEVLEDILYGSIRIPLVKLCKNLDLSEDELVKILHKLNKTGLFLIEKDAIVVDKDVRKYYDYQIMKFDEDFKPNMNFIQGLLKKVPIHILPIWYSVPRSSNNIFGSMIERYFKTPQIYERYLLDLNLNEPVMAGIISDLFNAENLELPSELVIEKYQLNREDFEEYMLHLEFNFVCCLTYQKEEDKYVEMITPFHEWRDYLLFKKRHTPVQIAPAKMIKKNSSKNFHFIRDMTYLLEEVIQKPLALKASAKQDFLFDGEVIKELVNGNMHKTIKDSEVMPWQLYFSRLASRLVRLGLAIRHEEMLCPHHHAPHWLNMEVEDKALYLYRHPNNRTLKMGFSDSLDTEKNVKEVEKSLERIESDGWFCIDEFLKGAICAIGENEPISLHKEGPDWWYKRPVYQDEELQFMKYVIMQRLYEVGMIDVGEYQGKDCFTLLQFGKDTLC